MAIDDERGYRAFFQNLRERPPFEYQFRVWRLLAEGHNLVLRAPTGAGKTLAVLGPFLYAFTSVDPRPAWQHRPARLIYALPLRSLAQGIYREARQLSGRLGLPLTSVRGEHGQEVITPFVTLQTGEQPDDPFFDRGRIIVTTYDQVLSGLLGGPYGLSSRLHNVNAAIVTGSLVVFDEFHLMEPQRAFLTAVAGLRLFHDLCQSVWMTATATRPLERVLSDALGVVTIPSTDAEQDELLESLPSVTSVTRELVMVAEDLSVDAVLRVHRRRSFVLLNTVGRAQAMFEALRARILAERREIALILLHSRFFKADRRLKEDALQSLFGACAVASEQQAILVATQVVEAGLDISCDRLHTEICPMNALVQRAGRCARFAGESGTVYVYPLPSAVPRAWLPYGDQTCESATLKRTRDLLARIGRAVFDAKRAAQWVQEVHADEDEGTLREGWGSRLRTCLHRIGENAFGGGKVRVADLIRGDGSEAIQVIIGEREHLPEAPGGRESLGLPRWSVERLVRQAEGAIGWFWDGSSEEPWRLLREPGDLARAYVVCLRPAVAAYDDHVGFRLGVTGERESPEREPPPRPGYAPLRAEDWSDHARRVADAAERRVDRDECEGGLLERGLRDRYGLEPKEIREAARAVGLLHDVGKLQASWQEWAEAAQHAKEAQYQHRTALAHTDFNPEDPEDRRRERTLGRRRPPHAPASAYYGRAFIGGLLRSVSRERTAYVASACIAAVLSHHGGWWLPNVELDPPRLWPGWRTAVDEAMGPLPDEVRMETLRTYRVEKLLQATTGGDALLEWWPLVAYLTRTLRLADQRATQEHSGDE